MAVVKWGQKGALLHLSAHLNSFCQLDHCIKVMSTECKNSSQSHSDNTHMFLKSQNVAHSEWYVSSSWQ